MNSSTNKTARHEHVVLNTSRWESSTIVEWVTYYKVIGFDHIYIYCNDDEPFEMYERLQYFIEGADPFVTFHHMPYQGQQPACWIHFLDNYKDQCNWFMFVDADEFLAIKPHNSIKEFMAAREHLADCIHFNWIWFGPQDYVERPPGSTLLNFTSREDERLQMNYFTKTITRSAAVDSRLVGRPPVDMLNHRWPPTISSRLREINVLGEAMADFFSEFPASAEKFMSNVERRSEILDTACIYHFLFRSRNDFKRRVDRGTLGAYYFQPMWGNLPSRKEEFEDFLGRINSKQDLYLHDFWANYISKIKSRAEGTALVSRNTQKNLARASTPIQSSVSPWSKGNVQQDARGAINGLHSGGDGFHTEREQNPWWCADLGGLCEVREVRVFNSLKSPSMAARAFPLVIEISENNNDWKRVFFNAGLSPFGGADGHPLIVSLNETCRYVKLSLDTCDYFHLDEIEIYGTERTSR